jgi:hypothetical protein
MRPLLACVLLSAVLAWPAGAATSAADAPPLLDVPYLPQTEALCGGAAVAMVFRYWGDRRADVQQFAPLVDWRAGGIADDVLVEAVAARGWRAIRLQASLSTIRERLDAGQPLVLLIEDRPGRYHYVVTVGSGPEHVVLHDPARGPAQRLAVADFLRAWRAAGNWALLVLPGGGGLAPVERSDETSTAGGTAPGAGTPCARLLAGAVDEIGTRGLEAGDAILATVRARCPADAGPLRELAGVRFGQGRWGEAAAFAVEALARDPADTYAWDLLGSSRFLQNDLPGALQAWNRIGQPRLDSIRIDGLSRTRYAVVADALALTPNAVLTNDAFRLAERRLHDLPAQASARLRYRPDAEGYATVDVAFVEPPARPAGAFAWAARAARAVVDREVEASIPGGTGQGEIWTAGWRWWDERPRARLTFAAPRAGRLAGVWRVDAAWEAQAYALSADTASIRETRTHGGLTMGHWLTPDVRFSIGVGADSWNGERHTLSIGGSLERRFLSDRVSAGGTARAWTAVDAGSPFQTAGAFLAAVSSTATQGRVHTVSVGIEGASRAAPMALWSGAGEGQARGPLLRAHPLLVGGAVSGPAFGRRLAYLNAETQQWLERPRSVRVGLAVFADAAHASHRGPTAEGSPLHIDAGIGLRLRLPGSREILRFDFGRGLRDGRHALTIGVARAF